MAATASAWAKPGSWALDAEEHDATTEKMEGAAPAAEFPSLADAATAKVSKKKKKLSLAEFTNGRAVTHGSGATAKFIPSATNVADHDLVLPTGPRERTAEELEGMSSRGFRYSSYGGGGGRREETEGGQGRWGVGRVSDDPRKERDRMPPLPSRADEVNDWSAGKRSSMPEMERNERSRGGFFDSKSRADESDSWISNKSAVGGASMSAVDGRRTREGYRERERRGDFEFGRDASNVHGSDADSWGRRREGLSDGGGVNGAGPDGDNWGKKKEDVSGGVRPRLVLQPRKLPLENGDGGKKEEVVVKSKSSNPFGAARPREEVLKEKGLDSKKIDEMLDELTIRPSSSEGHGHGRRSSGHRLESSWRKPDPVATPSPPSSENVEGDSCDTKLDEELV